MRLATIGVVLATIVGSQTKDAGAFVMRWGWFLGGVATPFVVIGIPLLAIGHFAPTVTPADIAELVIDCILYSLPVSFLVKSFIRWRQARRADKLPDLDQATG
jgi:cytochrome c biogenesis protein CcdA